MFADQSFLCRYPKFVPSRLRFHYRPAADNSTGVVQLPKVQEAP